MAGLSLRNIEKIYPNGYHAVKNLNLEIEDKEFIVLVGPSGCGKSTTLRMIAGLEEISSGELYIGDRLVNDIPPKDRDIAMVFQNYALYPHMTVFDNMAFGLKLRKKSKDEIKRRVHEAAKILDIEHLLDRKPKQLSGGQRQRVALGRAIVREPKVFLMDEPLSNLDAKLRVQMRAEINKLHNRLQTTFIYVTHDQTEAMTMGTRIVVMKDGIVQQVADPQTIYNHPANIFVASFIGSPQMNFIDCKITEENGGLYAVFNGNKVQLPEDKAKLLKDKDLSRDYVLGIRPENIYLASDDKGSENRFGANIEVVETLGSESYLYLRLNDREFIARVAPDMKVRIGENVKISFEKEKIHIFDKESEKAIF
ncbi:carbohydrate ABC transporter ATP-binding protein, CUT1 family (TC 3.A.1.1.-) [Caminicella sporogenes DSM 14501]|uniref:Carbohydrate ABC transporter ATP-binding protein, CUT1 family (TC 3.A.1.1.-) n=1 Tax=Caminicella sporogenes DSM 14501 TaxID=1121266 RepID=A0A1M6T0N6_9FIRM|nr:sn-glycerol-3-phosphate ABC transporter ATP-binding protein UgpC [Caminicella sporogenes]RKD26377.1 sugar ABC transporter ATP-binding protein [Caminicella sporogenes]SHK50469.1 carbohydrate ABC transporter ATP-binding protein, CUT1 family (TC 3.A.1.1.-) [Caminicella sporogenes DSM 14501]